MKTFNDFINSIKDQNDLTVNESKKAFDQILSQKIEEKKIIDFLTSLSRKGESVNEILGAVKSIKKKQKLFLVLKTHLILVVLVATVQKHLIFQQPSLLFAHHVMFV